jgi:hypothetical protein
VIDGAAGVAQVNPLGHGACVELPPALVERHPHDDTGTVAQQVHHGVEVAEPLLSSVGVAASEPGVMPV